MTALPLPPGQTPRAWQLQAVKAIRSAFQSGLRRVIVTAATGTGKGTLLAGLARSAEARRVLILVHRDELIRDLAARVRLIAGGPVGIVRGAENGMGAGVVVASVQTLKGARLAQVGLFGLVITDECHHATAPTYQAVYDRVNDVRKGKGLGPVPHVGLTATPFRTGKDGTPSGLGDAYEAIVYEHGIVEAIEAGDLVRPIGLRIDTQVELSAVGMRGRDYDPDELAGLIDCEARNEAVADWYVENGDGRAFLAFAVSVAHAERVAAALKARGVACEAVWGDMPSRERRRIVGAFQAGELAGLVSRDLLFEGFDAPRVEVLLALRPTKSPIIRWQLLGRGLRLHPGKTACVVADFVGFLGDLDLTMRVDLSATEKGTAPGLGARPAVLPGDLVIHRYEADRGVGQVVTCDGVLATVAWGLTDGAKAERRQHGVAELQRAPREAVDQTAVPIRVTGQSEHVVTILGGAESGVAWIDVDGDWVASAGAPDRSSLHAVVRTSGGRWVLWLAHRSADGQARAWAHKVGPAVVYRTGQAGRVELMRAGEAWLLAKGKASDPRSPERQLEASEGELMAVRRAGYRRGIEGVNRGEAVALVGAAWGRAAVADEIKRLRREYAGGGR